MISLHSVINYSAAADGMDHTILAINNMCWRRTFLEGFVESEENNEAKPQIALVKMKTFLEKHKDCSKLQLMLPHLPESKALLFFNPFSISNTVNS